VPGLEGRLTQSGSPVANAQVLVGGNAAGCEGAVNAQKTNADGVFRIAPQTEFRLEYLPLEAPMTVSTWEVCIEHEGKKVLGFRGLNFQSRTGPIVIACDLDKQYPQAGRNTQGICQFVPVPTREGTAY
jgi:hypothetical protein